MVSTNGIISHSKEYSKYQICLLFITFSISDQVINISEIDVAFGFAWSIKEVVDTEKRVIFLLFHLFQSSEVDIKSKWSIFFLYKDDRGFMSRDSQIDDGIGKDPGPKSIKLSLRKGINRGQ